MSNFSEDWVSVLAIIIAGVIGLIKSRTKQKEVRTSPIPRSADPEQKEYSWMEQEQQQEIPDISETIIKEPEPVYTGDFYRDPKIEWTKSEEEESTTIKTDFTLLIEDDVQEEPEYVQFDARQAIISSEILQRRSY